MGEPGKPVFLGALKQVCGLHLTLWPPRSPLSPTVAMFSSSRAQQGEERGQAKDRSKAAGEQLCGSPRVSNSEASKCSPSERGAGITLQNQGALVSEQEQWVTPHKVSSSGDIGGCIYLALAPLSSGTLWCVAPGTPLSCHTPSHFLDKGSRFLELMG